MDLPDQLQRIATDSLRAVRDRMTVGEKLNLLELVTAEIYRVQRDTMVVSLLAFQGGEPDDIGKDGHGKNGADGGPRLTVDEDGSISLG